MSLLAVAVLVVAFELGAVGQLSVERGALEPRVRAAFGPLRVGILDAGEGASCPGLESAAEGWRARVRKLSWSAEPVRASALQPASRAFQLVIAPSLRCLDPSSADAVADYVASGGGLIAIGAPAEAAPSSAEEGAAAARVVRMLGAERVQSWSGARRRFVSLREGSPLAAGIAGFRLEVGTEGALAVAEGPHPYWSDPKLQPADPSLPQSYQLAALTSGYGAGRVAWIGFDVTPREDAAPAEQLLRNALTWAAGLPVVSVAPWPEPYRCAVLLRANVAARPQNASSLTLRLLESGAQATFVVAQNQSGALERLEPTPARGGELALAPVGTAESSSPLAVLALAIERLRVRRSLGAWPNALAPGALPAGESAERAGALAGFDHLLSDGDRDSVRPSSVTISQRWGPFARRLQLVDLGRVLDDDLAISPLGVNGLDPAWVRRRLLADFDVVAELGGAYVLSIHTHGLGAAEWGDTLAQVVDDYRRRGGWVADSAEIAAWARARAALDVQVQPGAVDSARIIVRSAAVQPLGPVALDVFAPVGSRLAIEAPSGVWRLQPAAGATPARLVLATAAPGAEYACTLRYGR